MTSLSTVLSHIIYIRRQRCVPHENYLSVDALGFSSVGLAFLILTLVPASPSSLSFLPAFSLSCGPFPWPRAASPRKPCSGVQSPAALLSLQKACQFLLAELLSLRNCCSQNTSFLLYSSSLFHVLSVYSYFIFVLISKMQIIMWIPNITPFPSFPVH